MLTSKISIHPILELIQPRHITCTAVLIPTYGSQLLITCYDDALTNAQIQLRNVKIPLSELSI